jgi:hypothetical protein
LGALANLYSTDRHQQLFKEVTLNHPEPILKCRGTGTEYSLLNELAR